MKIVGIDASLTATGIVIYDTISRVTQGEEQYLSSHRSTVITSKQDGVRRIIDLRNQVASCLPGADLVAIEGYAFAAKNQAHQLGELGGVLRVMFHESGIKWIEVAPQQVKKFATGSGNAGKDVMLQQVYKRWGAEFKTSHEADAYALAKIGEAYLGRVAGLTSVQLNVVEEIRGGRSRKATAYF